MAQKAMESQAGPAANPLPGASQELQEEHEEVVERADLGSTERAGQSLVDEGIGIMVAVIVIGAVAIPVAQEVLNTANLTGTTAQIVGYVPLALGVGLFVAAISIVR
jgi:hypothetical protein